MNDAGNTPIETGETAPESSTDTGTNTGTKADTGATEKARKTGADAPEALTVDAVSAMVQKMFADYTSKQEAQQTEAEKLAGMNGTQRLEYERDNYKSQLEALQKQVTMGQMQSTARAMLAEKDIHAPDNLIAAIVTADAETTKQNVEDFAKLFSGAVDAAVRQRLKSETPRTGKAAGKMTKEQIFAIADDDKRIDAIRNNMDLFQ